MNNSIISLILLLALSLHPTVAPAATTGDLAEGAPERYVVVQGDTLWGIAKRFLKDPWKWPELWKANQGQIANPNRIFPGDVLVLDRSAQELRLKLSSAESVKLSPEVRITALAPEPVPSIPTADIEPFLSKPLVVAQNQLADAARIVRTQENRVALGAGNIAYARGLTKQDGVYWQVLRTGRPLIDPVNNETLGYDAVFLGDAKVQKFGDISTIEIISSPQEIYSGDYLLPAPRDISLSSYVPHPPGRKVEAHIIAAFRSLYETGPASIVTLSRGTRDGLEVGNVLAIYRNLNAPAYNLRESSMMSGAGIVTSDPSARSGYVNEPLGGRNSPLYGRVGPAGAQFKNDKTNVPTAILPDERYGLLMVFRVFERASYALVMTADKPVNVLDIATNP